MNDSTSPKPPRKISTLLALLGVIAGSMVTAGGLLVVAFCAYTSWQKFYSATAASGSDDPADLMPVIQSLHSTMMVAVVVTLAGLAVLVVALWVLPGKKRKG